MKQLEAIAHLQKLGVPIFTTNDVATLFSISTSHATKLLSRLVQSNILIKLSRGLWGFEEKIDPMILPGYLTAPFPSYISLQTALYYYGVISQIPSVIYAVSIGKTKKVTTPVGTVSIHHIDPDFFFGFDMIENGITMASLEKSLIDALYLIPTKTRLFSRLPEIEIPKTFNINKDMKIVSKIRYPRRRQLVSERLTQLLQSKV